MFEAFGITVQVVVPKVTAMEVGEQEMVEVLSGIPIPYTSAELEDTPSVMVDRPITVARNWKTIVLPETKQKPVTPLFSGKIERKN